MPGHVIGKSLPLGYPGNVSRMSDAVIAPYKYDIAHASDGNIEFGDAVCYDSTNGGVRKIASDEADGSAIIGIAVRRMGQPKADNANGWYYEPGETVDVLLRGSVVVALEATTGIAAMGAVYVNKTTGKLSSVSTGGVAIPNAKFGSAFNTTDKLAEITLVERVV